MSQRWLGAGVALSVALSITAQAPAQAIPARQGATPVATENSAPGAHRDQEAFGVGAQLGFYNPNGLAVRAGARELSLEVAAGFVPTLLGFGDSQRPKLKFLLPFEVSPQLVIHAVTFKDNLRGALRLGYRYNTALGHGATLGGQLEKRVTPKLLLEGMWGVSYYPNASDRLWGNQVKEGTSFTFPPELALGLTVGVLVYP